MSADSALKISTRSTIMRQRARHALTMSIALEETLQLWIQASGEITACQKILYLVQVKWLACKNSIKIIMIKEAGQNRTAVLVIRENIVHNATSATQYSHMVTLGQTSA